MRVTNIHSAARRPEFFLLTLCVIVYNINKYYLRFLPMDNEGFRLITDVLPNFIIVFIFFFLMTLVNPLTLSTEIKRLWYYGGLVLFCGLLVAEEITGMFRMSKVSDVSDSLASCAAVLFLVSIHEVNFLLGKSK